MSRTLTAGMLAEIAKRALHPLFAVELDFPSGIQRLHTGCGDLTIDGETFTGCGNFSSISNISEGSTLEANGVRLSLSGIDLAEISVVLTDQYQGRPARVWLGFFDDSYDLVVDPVLLDVLRLDDSDIEHGEGSRVNLGLESLQALWGRPNLARYTSADQQVDWPEDKFFDFVPRTVDQEITWPHAPASSGSSGKKGGSTFPVVPGSGEKREGRDA